VPAITALNASAFESHICPRKSVPDQGEQGEVRTPTCLAFIMQLTSRERVQGRSRLPLAD
jgi:hypothetical protein